MTHNVHIGRMTKFYTDPNSGKVEESEEVEMHMMPIVNYDICNPNLTDLPRWAARTCANVSSGSFDQFFARFGVIIDYKSFNPSQYRIIDIIEKIRKAKIPKNELNADRLVWLKYWSELALQEYGEDALIGISE